MKQVNDMNFHECVFKRLLEVLLPLLDEREELLTSVLLALAAGTRKCNKAKELLISVRSVSF
jgi:hypothetical protein